MRVERPEASGEEVGVPRRCRSTPISCRSSGPYVVCPLSARTGNCVQTVVPQSFILKSKLSGDEVYYTACSLLVIPKHSCSKLHCQKAFEIIPFSYKIVEPRSEHSCPCVQRKAKVDHWTDNLWEWTDNVWGLPPPRRTPPDARRA